MSDSLEQLELYNEFISHDDKIEIWMQQNGVWSKQLYDKLIMNDINTINELQCSSQNKIDTILRSMWIEGYSQPKDQKGKKLIKFERKWRKLHNNKTKNDVQHLATKIPDPLKIDFINVINKCKSIKPEFIKTIKAHNDNENYEFINIAKLWSFFNSITHFYLIMPNHYKFDYNFIESLYDDINALDTMLHCDDTFQLSFYFEKMISLHSNEEIMKPYKESFFTLKHWEIHFENNCIIMKKTLKTKIRKKQYIEKADEIIKYFIWIYSQTSDVNSIYVPDSIICLIFVYCLRQQRLNINVDYKFHLIYNNLYKTEYENMLLQKYILFRLQQESIEHEFNKDNIGYLLRGYIKQCYIDYGCQHLDDDVHFDFPYDIIDILTLYYYGITLKIGDRIRLVRGQTGIVKYIGAVQFTVADVVGVVLDSWHPNTNDGSVRGIKYFDAPSGRGYFIKREEVRENLGAVPLHEIETSLVNAPMPKINFKVGDKVKLSKGECGMIKYIGETKFCRGEVIGIELDRWTVNGHNGIVNGHQYFKSSAGRGCFVRRSSISNIIIPHVKPFINIDKKSAKYQINQLMINDRIMIKENKRKGVIKYIGYPLLTDGEVIGVELDKWISNGNDGSMNDIQLFEALPGFGVFLRRYEIKKLEEEEEILQQKRKDLRCGDVVKINNYGNGMVKYIGPVTGKVLYDEYRIGIELQTWNPNASDGRYDGFRYFTAAAGRGIFVERTEIIDVITKYENVQSKSDDTIHNDTYSNNSTFEKKIGDRVKLINGRFGTIKSIHHDKNDCFMPVYNIEMDKYGIIKAKQTEHKNDDSINEKDNNVILGETVELESGQIGTIRYYGTLHFAKGHWYGIELHNDFGQHNGIIRGIRYFECPDKRGVFVKHIIRKKYTENNVLHRRCPECCGSFIKKRNPKLAYDSVGIVCDGCYNSSDKFNENDWYFQCSECQQIDYCFGCMLTLDSDIHHEGNNRIVHTKLSSIHNECIFKDISIDEYYKSISISKREEYLVYGYIHDANKLLLSKTYFYEIPMDIINTIWLFYKIKEHFTHCSAFMEISSSICSINDILTISQQNPSGTSCKAYGNFVIDLDMVYGQPYLYRWTFSILENKNNDGYENSNDNHDKNIMLGIEANYSHKYWTNIVFRVGDCIEMELDWVLRQITFSINSVDKDNKKIENIDVSRTYKLFVSTNECCSIQIVNFSAFVD